MPSRTRIFFLNGLAITLTSLVIRGVSVAFNIYVSSVAGAEAMGLFSLITSVYGFFITIACSSINLGTTRLVSEALGEDNNKLLRDSIKVCIRHALITGMIASVVLFSFSGFIGKHLLYDERCIISLKAVSFSLLPISLTSCLSGYFTAVRRVKVNAFFQIVTQGLKIFATAALLSRFLKFGAEYACLCLILGTVISELVSLGVNIILYFIDKSKNLPKLKNLNEKKSSDGIVKKICKITFPVTFSACIRSLFNTLQHILIPRGLKLSGSSWAAALSSYGILHSMVLPLILFPSAFIYSFASLLIPEVAECRVRGDSARLTRITRRIITLAMIFALGISGVMFLLSGEIGEIVYKNAEASFYIKILAPLIPIMYIDGATDAILKGMGKQIYSMNVNIADAALSCVLVFFLVPRLGLYGYIVSIYATEILNTTLSLIGMFSSTKTKPKIKHQLLSPLLCIILSGVVSSFILENINHPFSPVIELCLHISLVTILYFVMLLVTKTIGKEENEVIYYSLKK